MFIILFIKKRDIYHNKADALKYLLWNKWNKDKYKIISKDINNWNGLVLRSNWTEL